MYKQMNEWKHVFKLDPAKTIGDEQLEKVCESGTDAVIVGGTDNITLDGVLDLLSRIRRFAVPCILEVSNMESITPGFDYYFIPMVLNSTEKKWMMDIQHQAVKEYQQIMAGYDLFAEGYCIMNEEAKAFKQTNCRRPSYDDVIAYALMAERLFQLPIFYLEYSGTYGDPELVTKVKNELKQTLLFYGGGIQTPEQAVQMGEIADIIVVGNSLYTDFQNALKTVNAVKDKR
ncbi:MAG TPA: heptaprenylglyceryl phosphate synthase [Bacillota bacterium]|nr:heptaprenylglyceryl phosphate synthase [Bacillota bacterium]